MATFNSIGVVLYLFGYRGFYPRLITFGPCRGNFIFLLNRWIELTMRKNEMHPHMIFENQSF